MKKKPTVHIGFEVGTGNPVAIPLAHIFVTGQTQASGKTTALQAIVARSGCRALAFVTKRGERGLSDSARMIRPYLPREGDEPISWRLVETLIASALGQRAMPKERYGIMSAAKGQTSLAGVRKRAAELMKTSKGETARMYELLGEYLDLVLPEMRELGASPTLELGPGLNVMDLSEASEQLQAMVMRAALERIYEWKRDILTVFPEAWEFAPRDRMTPARPAAEALARKGAGLGNFLLSDSQDIAGVSTVIRQAAGVWLVGVQREANERKRMIDVIRSSVGVAPRADEVATLPLGQFYVCHGRTAVKTYVQPAWMSEAEARAIALGGGIESVKRIDVTPPPPPKPAAFPKPVKFRPAEANLDDDPAEYSRVAQLHDGLAADSSIPFTASPPATPGQPEGEDDMVDDETKQLVRQILQRMDGNAAPTGVTVMAAKPADAPSDERAMYERFKGWLLAELPSIASGRPVQVTPPEKLRKDFQKAEAERIIATIKDLRPLPKRILKLLETTSEAVRPVTIAQRLGRPTGGGSWTDQGKAIKDLVSAGVAESKERVGVRSLLREKIVTDLAFYTPAEAEIEAVYQTALYHIATDGQGDA